MGKSARQLVVTLHVLSSAAWMTTAVALLALLLASAGAPPGETKVYAAWAAEFLDTRLLALAANTSAFTGLVLAAATPWGFVRHRWVAAKLVLTIAQLYAGIFVLSGALHETVVAAEVGQDGPAVAVAVGAGLMASALAFQVWLSVAKPRGELRGGRGKTAPAWVFVLGVAAPVVDLVVGTLRGSPLPVASLLTLAVLAVVLPRTRRRTTAGAPVGAGRQATQLGASPSSSP